MSDRSSSHSQPERMRKQLTMLSTLPNLTFYCAADIFMPVWNIDISRIDLLLPAGSYTKVAYMRTVRKMEKPDDICCLLKATIIKVTAVLNKLLLCR